MSHQSALDAALNLVFDYPGGASSLAPRMGKSATSLCHELKGTGTAKLGLADTVKMSELANDDRVLNAWAMQRGKMLVDLPEAIDPGADTCMQATGAVTQGVAALVTQVCTAKDAGGRVTDNALRAFRRDMGRLIAQLQALDGAMAADNAVGKPPAAPFPDIPPQFEMPLGTGSGQDSHSAR